MPEDTAPRAKPIRAAESKRATLAEANALANTVELYSERIAELEFALEDRTYLRLSAEGSREFSRYALGRIAQLCRVMYLKNPLIHRAVNLMRYYVFGQGVTFTARNDGVNAALRAFWDDPKNKKAFTSNAALGKADMNLRTTGNLFCAFFTNPSRGMVRVRTFPFDEVQEILTDPDDRETTWFYRRDWVRNKLDTSTGTTIGELQTTYYPDWRHYIARDSAKRQRKSETEIIDQQEYPDKINGHDVAWDVPVMHVAVGQIGDMRFGVPEIYSALDWARAVKENMEDFATTSRALARWAWNLTVKGGKPALASAKSRLGTTVNTGSVGQGAAEQNPPPLTGSTFLNSEGAAKLEAINTAGARPNANDARGLRLMVAAAVDLPEVMLMGDADVGNLATAKTLDRPTELAITDRQEMWKALLTDVFHFVLRAAVLAPSHPLKGTVEPDEATDEEVIKIADDEQGDGASFDINFPSVLEHDVAQTVTAIVDAATLQGRTSAGVFPDQIISKLLAAAVGVDDIDGMMEKVYPQGDDTPATGNLTPPPTPGIGPGGEPLAIGPGKARENAELTRAIEALRQTILDRNGDSEDLTEVHKCWGHDCASNDYDHQHALITAPLKEKRAHLDSEHGGAVVPASRKGYENEAANRHHEAIHKHVHQYAFGTPSAGEPGAHGPDKAGVGEHSHVDEHAEAVFVKRKTANAR